jgi:hypothetical protein
MLEPLASRIVIEDLPAGTALVEMGLELNFTVAEGLGDGDREGPGDGDGLGEGLGLGLGSDLIKGGGGSMTPAFAEARGNSAGLSRVSPK